MGLWAKIKDGLGGGYYAEVTPRNALKVSNVLEPTFESQKSIPYRQYITIDGEKDGSNDMRVIGSQVAPIDFFIEADVDNDIYISQLSFLIADQGAIPRNFGNISALTNGCRLFYTNKALGEIEIHDKLTSNFDFIRLGLGEPSFGSGNDAFRINNVVSTSEGYIPVVDFTRLMPPFGIKLDAGTTTKLVFQVADDTTGVDAFNCIAYGFERIPD